MVEPKLQPTLADARVAEMAAAIREELNLSDGLLDDLKDDIRHAALSCARISDAALEALSAENAKLRELLATVHQLEVKEPRS